MKLCMIRQPCGLGDILFTQKIAKLILKKGQYESIIWPVIKQFSYLNQYIGAPGINFIDENKDFPHKQIYESNICGLYEEPQLELLYIPQQSADQVIGYNPETNNHPMYAKYELCNNLDYSDWYKYVSIKRNKKREKKLEKFIGVDLKTPYNVVNRNYGSPPHPETIDKIDIYNEYPIIEMDFLGFDNLFDWMGILEHAKEVHTVETSLCYLLTLMSINNVTVYARKKYLSFPLASFGYVNKIYSKGWKYVTSTCIEEQNWRALGIPVDNTGIQL